MQKKSAYRYKSYIAIGSNIGNWKSNFNLALKLMNKFGHVEKVSRVYFTKPFGITNQKYFHNAAFLFTTNLYFNELFIKMCMPLSGAGTRNLTAGVHKSSKNAKKGKIFPRNRLL